MTSDFPAIGDMERPIPPFEMSGMRWNGEQWVHDTPGEGGLPMPNLLPSHQVPGLAAAVPPAVAQGASAAIPAAAAATTTAASIADQIRRAMTNPRNVAGLAALIPMLTTAFGGGGGGNNPFGSNSDLANEVTNSLAMQRKRMEQAQPVYDTLVNMSYGMSPTRYRSAAPAGYTPNAAPQGAYQYDGPRFR